MATYYVDPAGSDSTGNGSSANPWLTLAHGFASIAGGDTLSVNNGTYTLSTSVSLTASGTDDAHRTRIVSTNRRGAKLVNNIALTDAASDATMQIYADYVDIEGFDISGTGRIGIYSAGSATGSGSPLGAHNRFLHNYIHDLGNALDSTHTVFGIDLARYGSGVYNAIYNTCDGNILRNIGGAHNSSDHGIYYGTAYGTIQNNIVSGVPGYGIRAFHFTNHMIITNNLVFNCGDASLDPAGGQGGGIYLSAGGTGWTAGVDEPHDFSVVANNIVRDCVGWGGILETANNFGNPNPQVVANNTFLNNCTYNNSGVHDNVELDSGASHQNPVTAPIIFTTREADTFSRANQSGWGTASNGHTWTNTGDVNTVLSIASNQGSATNSNLDNFLTIGSSYSEDMEVLVRLSTSTTSTFNSNGSMVRWIDANNWYIAQLRNAQFRIRKNVAGTTSNVGTAITFAYAANTEYWIRFNITGTTLSAKVWADGSSEPSSWSIVGSDSSLTSGYVGLYFGPASTSTTTVYDTFSAAHPSTDPNFPYFVNYQTDGSGDYHLQATSPCINAGTATGAPTTDADGISRPQGVRYDIGPYERSASTMASRANPYGVTVAVFNSQPYKYSSQLFPDLNTLGLGAVRFQQDWGLIETSKGVYNWAALDDMVARCNAAGYFVQFPIRNAPDWYNTTLVNPSQTNRTTCPNSNWTNDYIYSMDPVATGNFAAILAKRYNGKTTPNPLQPGSFLFLDAIEIGNEDFDVKFDCHSSTGAGYLGQEARLAKWYIQVVQAAAPKIRANSPNTLVGMFGSWWMDITHRVGFWTDMYNARDASGTRIASYLDYFNFHFYIGGDPNVDAGGTNVSLPHTLTQLNNVVKSFGDNKHFWVTEIGWAAYEFSQSAGDPTWAQIATYYQEAMDDMRTSGIVDRFNLFTMAYDPNGASWKAGKSITQPAGYTPHFEPPATTIQSYAQAHPQWTSSPPATQPLITSPTTLSFSAVVGGGNPANQSVTVTNPNGSSASYTVSSDSGTWLAVSPTSGTITASGNIISTISVTTGALTAGTYNGNISYVANSLTTTVPVTFVVTAATPAGGLSVTPTTFSFTAVAGGANPATQSVTLANSDTAAGTYTTMSDSSWLTISPTSGTISANGGTQGFTVTATTGALAVGTYMGTLTWTDAVSSTTCSVTFVVTASAPVPTPTPILNLGTYTVAVAGNPVFVQAGTLSIDYSVGRRSQASFVALTDTNTQFEQYEQVQIYDQHNTLVFSGYITEPTVTKPGFQPFLEHAITCTDQHFLADKRVVAASYTNRTCGFIVQDIFNTILTQEGVTVGVIYDGITPADTLYPSLALYPGGNVGLVPGATFVYCTVAQAMDALVTEASASGVPYYWMIDQRQQLWFAPYGTQVWNPNLGYMQTVLNDNPPGYYRLGDPSATIAFDATTNHYDGTITGGVTIGAAGAVLIDTDTAMTFDGSTGYVALPAGLSLNGATAFSVEAWIQPNATFAQYGRIVASDYVNGNKKGFQLGVQPNAAGLFLSIGDGTNMYEVDANSAVSTVGYTYVVGVWSGSLLYIYVNGGLIASLPASITLGAATYSLNIGRSPDNSNYFPGKIDEVAVYNYALTPVQIANHYNLGITQVASSTIIDGSQIDQVYNPPTLKRANPKYRNTQYAIGGTQQTLQQTEIRQGDGNTVSWAMGYDLSSVPTVSVNPGNGSGGYLGYTTLNVGIKGVDINKDFYWNKGDPTITQDSSGTKLRGSPYNDLLQVVYYGQYPSTFLSQNGAQITYQQNLDGTTGIVEDVLVNATISDATTGLNEVASTLTRYGQQGQLLEFSTLTPGFAPGQLAPVLLPDLGINSVQQMLIEEVSASDQQDSSNIWYRVRAMIGPYDTTWVAFFSSLLTNVAQANSINIGVAQTLSLLAPFTISIAPSATLAISVFACPIPNTTLNPATTLYPC